MTDDEGLGVADWPVVGRVSPERAVAVGGLALGVGALATLALVPLDYRLGTMLVATALFGLLSALGAIGLESA